MKFSRIWSMPNPDTFQIKPIGELLDRVLKDQKLIVDPFSRTSLRASLSNDLNPETPALFHMDAVDFLDMLIEQGLENSVDVCLLDPPYSPRQISECYKSIGKKATAQDTQNARLYAACKDKMTKLLKPEGIAVTCGWNSNGFGLNRGFRMDEILLVPCGAAHNDYIVTVETKIIPS